MSSGFTPKGEYRQNWTDAEAAFSESGDSLEILGNPVMEKWEDAYMGELATVAASNGGKVLEVGFGLGLSASHIQSHSNVSEHVIIEFNREVYERLEAFAARAAERGRTVTPIFGDWKTVVSDIPDSSFDGILYDTYPLSEAERDTHQFGFISRANAYRILKPRGVLTYCNLTSFGNLKQGYADTADGNQQLFDETQRQSLRDAGFRDDRITVRTADVRPDPDCAYYRFTTALVPVIEK